MPCLKRKRTVDILSPGEKGGALFARLIATWAGEANLREAVLLEGHVALTQPLLRHKKSRSFLRLRLMLISMFVAKL